MGSSRDYEPQLSPVVKNRDHLVDKNMDRALNNRKGHRIKNKRDVVKFALEEEFWEEDLESES